MATIAKQILETDRLSQDPESGAELLVVTKHKPDSSRISPSGANWADAWRDSDRGENESKTNYNATRQWHFVDIEIKAVASPQRMHWLTRRRANEGSEGLKRKPALLDKIEEFRAGACKALTYPSPERILALKYLRISVGDVH